MCDCVHYFHEHTHGFTTDLQLSTFKASVVKPHTQSNNETYYNYSDYYIALYFVVEVEWILKGFLMVHFHPDRPFH